MNEPSSGLASAPGVLLCAGLLIAASLLTRGEGKAAGVVRVEPSSFDDTSGEDAQFFHERVLPVLAARCFECHGPDLERVKGGLRMGGRAALLVGGAEGPALVPGDPDASLLVQAVRYADLFLEMPPKQRLSPAEVAVLEDWVARGAPWVELGGAAALRQGGISVEAGRTWWAFRPVVQPEVPVTAHADLVRDPIDAFVFARLEEGGLEPAPPAERRVLARRLWFDLLGLPPTQTEIEAFVADQAPDAYERLVERLLARPEYGERWARHWLDLVRFAQTNGYERDTEKPSAWRYRDYVVRSLNQDKPYDRFVSEQIAGDELPDADADSLTATALYRLGAWDDEPADPGQARFDELDDNLRTISEGFLGVTMGCCRCHDHKFDPFPQEDYYRMLAFLRSVRPYEKPIFGSASSTLRPLEQTPKALAEWEAARAERHERLDDERRALVARGREILHAEELVAIELPAEQRSERQRQLLDARSEQLTPTEEESTYALPTQEQHRWFALKMQLKALADSFEGDLAWTLCATEAGGEPVPTHLLVRGAASDPGPEVQPRFPAVLCVDDAHSFPALPEVDPERASTGRRAALAAWITAPDNPLFARVIVNRVWQFHFGRGLVATPNDFGVQGLPPSHPELLDWLAAEFVADGWSLKRLHRRILESYAWRMASRVSPLQEARAADIDPDNLLLWRQRSQRLDAEVLRDSILSVAGTLESQRGGRGYFPDTPLEALAGMSRPGEGWGVSDVEQRNRRSLYMYAKRALPVPLMEVLDGPGSATLPIGRRTATTVAPQALTLMNDAFTGRAARDMALRVEREAEPDDRSRCARAFELALGRTPVAAEQDLLVEHLRRARVELAGRSRGTLGFRPAVPERVATGFLRHLDGSDMLSGPREGWTYLRGAWGGGYGGTMGQDPNDGPAALFEGLSAVNGVFTAQVRLAGGCRRAVLLLRAHPTRSGSAAGDAVQDEPVDDSPWNQRPIAPETCDGLELRLDAVQGTLQLWQHAGEVQLLASARAPLESDVWLALRVDLAGPRARVWIGDDRAPALDVQLESPSSPGALGMRSVGGLFELAEPQFVQSDAVTSLLPAGPADADLEALQSVCLMLFNLNEFAYAD